MHIHTPVKTEEKDYSDIKANRNMYIGGEWGTFCIVTNI